MREIKYRQRLKPAYCKNTESFHYWGFIDGCFHSPCNPNAVINYEDSEQYTGLKDKNGVEIFEGDIIESDRVRGIVFWCESGQWKLRVLNSKTNEEGLLYSYGHYYKVIGNIYENPELLEGLR